MSHAENRQSGGGTVADDHPHSATRTLAPDAVELRQLQGGAAFSWAVYGRIRVSAKQGPQVGELWALPVIAGEVRGAVEADDNGRIEQLWDLRCVLSWSVEHDKGTLVK